MKNLRKTVDNTKTSSVCKNFVDNSVLKAKGGSSSVYMHSQVKVVKNPYNGKFEVQKLEQSDVPGIYNSIIIDEEGNSRVESFARKNPDGSVDVEKHFESLDGTKTDYKYSFDGKNIKMFYKITDNRGKVLTTIDRTFARVNPNFAYSSVNGHSYEIKKDNKAFNVKDNLTGKTTIIPFDSIFAGPTMKNHSEVIDKLSGDMLLDVYNRHYLVDYAEDKDCYADGENMLLSVDDDLFTFAHEQSHSKDFLSDYEIETMGLDEDKMQEQDYYKLSLNPEFKETYEKEREAFMKAFPGIEQEYMDYFINKDNHEEGPYGGIVETLAESGALISHACASELPDIFKSRGYYLQKYFPKTIAIASRFLTPNSNLYVKD